MFQASNGIARVCGHPCFTLSSKQTARLRLVQPWYTFERPQVNIVELKHLYLPEIKRKRCTNNKSTTKDKNRVIC